MSCFVLINIRLYQQITGETQYKDIQIKSIVYSFYLFFPLNTLNKVIINRLASERANSALKEDLKS